MASSFTTNNGFKSFGVFKESQAPADYTLNKTAKTIFCNANVCVPSKSVGSQGQLSILRAANNLKYYDCVDSFDKTNLNVNLITKLDLTDVCVIESNTALPECPTPLGPQTSADASGVIIDPFGLLFGNDVCGINNFTRYMVYNPPSGPCGWTNPFGNGINNDPPNGQFPMVHGKNGDVFVGGNFTQVGDIPANSIACWNTETGLWSNPFGLVLNGFVNSLAYDSIRDILYVAGEFTITGVTGGTNIAKWENGVWDNMGSGQLYQCISTVIDTSNNILYVTSIDFNNNNAYLQKWTSSWNNVDQPSYPSAFFIAMALDGEKNLYVGGRFIDISGNTMNNIAKWSITSNSWSSLGSGLTGLVQICACILYDSTDNSLYVGGFWDNAGGISVKGIAKWGLNTSNWSVVGPGLKEDYPIIYTTSICKNINNNISVACIFVGSDFSVKETQIATFNGSNWAYSCVVTNSNPSIEPYLSCILQNTDNSIYAAGLFSNAGNVTATRIAKLDLSALSYATTLQRRTIDTTVDRKMRRRNRDLHE